MNPSRLLSTRLPYTPGAQDGGHDVIYSRASLRQDWAMGFALVGGVDEWDIYQTDEDAWLRELQDSDPKTAISLMTQPARLPMELLYSTSCIPVLTMQV